MVARRARALCRAPRPPRSRAHPGRTGSDAETTCCDRAGPSPCASRATRSRRSQPLRSPGNVETMISSIRSSFVACIAAVNGSGWTIWPCASMPSPRSSVSARRRRRSASVSSSPSRSACGATIRKLAGPSLARVRIRASSSLGDDGLVRDHEHVRLGVVALDRRRARPGRAPASCARCPRRRRGAASRTARRACVDTMISSTVGSSCASASLTACTGPVSTTKPCAAIPAASRSSLSVFSSLPARGGAARVLVDDVALARLVDRRDDGDAVVGLAASRTHGVEQRLPTRPSRSRSRGRASSTRALWMHRRLGHGASH